MSRTSRRSSSTRFELLEPFPQSPTTCVLGHTYAQVCMRPLKHARIRHSYACANTDTRMHAQARMQIHVHTHKHTRAHVRTNYTRTCTRALAQARALMSRQTPTRANTHAHARITRTQIRGYIYSRVGMKTRMCMGGTHISILAHAGAHASRHGRAITFASASTHIIEKLDETSQGVSMKRTPAISDGTIYP